MATTPFAGTAPAHVLGSLGAPVGGLGAALARIVVEQLAGESAENFAGTTVAHGADAAAGVVPGADLLIAHVVAVATMVQGWELGPLGLVLTLVWPLGGPVWAGLVPVHTTVAVVRRGWAWVRALPATRNGSAEAVVDTGRVTLRVLIVDDSALFRDLAARVLLRDAIEVVGVAGTVAEGMALVQEVRPDIALVDLHLGTESGLELARRVAVMPGASRPVVVVMSTHGESEVRELLPGSGAAGFLPKERLSGDALRLIVDATP
jgi:CheY-like chemotaxis protein